MCETIKRRVCIWSSLIFNESTKKQPTRIRAIKIRKNLSYLLNSPKFSLKLIPSFKGAYGTFQYNALLSLNSFQIDKFITALIEKPSILYIKDSI